MGSKLQNAWGKARSGILVMAGLLMFHSQECSGQRYFFENISVQQGLAASKVYAVVQDGFGMVWIGTEVGLARYDGNTVTNFGAVDGLAPNGARSLLVDAEGKLWAGHLDGGLSYFDGNSFRTFSLGEGMNSAVTGITQADDGAYWLATAGNGAYRFLDVPGDGGELSATHLAKENGIESVLLGTTRLSDDRICFIEDNGAIKVYNKGTGRFEELVLPGWQGVFECSALFQDSKGAIWVGTRGGGAFRFDPGAKRPTQYSPANGLPSGTVICFGEDGEGRTWVGTFDGGIALIQGDGCKTFDKDNGLHASFVRCISKDREGNLLIGTNDNGVDIFKGDRFVSFDEQDGLVDPQVWAVLEDDAGRTWFGTNSGIVILEKGSNASTRTIRTQDAQNGIGLLSNAIRSLREDDKGFVWIGTDKGLHRYDPRTQRVTPEVEVTGLLAFNNVTALEIGQPGELWIGGQNGLVRYVPGSGSVPVRYTEANGLADDHVVALYRDSRGTVWVGSTVKGITRIDNGQAQPVDLGKGFTATAFVEDQEGRIWVGTEGRGIVVLKGNKEDQNFTTEEGLLDNRIKALGVDDHGQVWIGTNRGLNKWRPKKGGFVAFTERAGFTGIEVKPNAVWSTGKGDIWFGTANGATRVGGESGSERALAPLVGISGWRVNDEDRPKADIDLDHTDWNVRIAYNSVSLSDPGAVRYMVMLEGLEEDWQPITTETSANYRALPPNNYVFMVKAMDRTGLWSDPPAELAFTIHPPWYRSWWFYTALALCCGIGLFSYIKVREKQLQMRNQVLEKRVKERTAEVVAQSREIEGQKVEIEGLLLNILPKEISEELKNNGKATARRHDAVTVMFTDMKGFTKAAEKLTPEQLVNELDTCFIAFDEIIGRYGIEKIKTIGDAYMCACGIPVQDPYHAHKVVLAALEIRSLMERWKDERAARGEEPWVLRIGAHSGPVVAGVVGKKKFAYDIWGDAVNVASRMESSGVPGELNISGATYELIKDRFECEHRGKIEAKNKGQIDMYFVRRIWPEFSADSEGELANERFLSEVGAMSASEQLA